jgi:hypothetical protein
LQEERKQLEKGAADMSLKLQRARTEREQQVAAARAAASITEGKLQSLLEELSNAKHTSEAASTTSGFVLKVGVHLVLGAVWGAVSAACGQDATARNCGMKQTAGLLLDMAHS